MSIQSAHRSNDENTRPHSGSTSSREADLGSAPIGSLLFKLALPAIAAQIINVLYNMVDRMYIGHIPDIGPSALTGVGVTMPIIMCISAFAALAAMGGAPQASILMGKGDKASAEKVLGNCTFMLTVISLVLTALFLGFGRPILLMFGASEKTILYAWNYMKIYVCGTFFVQMALGLNAFINAQGYAKTGMITVAIGALCNIILDPIFIFGLHLDVRGAALATILSQGISCIWILRFLTGTHSTLRIRLRNLRPQKKFILPCLALGLAPFIMQFTESALSISFNTSLLKYGGDTAVGAMTILSSVMQFSMLPLQGLSQGAQPIISFNYGAKNIDRVKKAFHLLLRSAACYSTLLWLLCMLVPQIFYFHLYQRRRSCQLYHLGAPDLYGSFPALCRPARLPADFYCPWKCENIRLSGIAPESAAFDSADLYPAAFRFKSGIRRVRGRTGGRYDCGDDDGSAVFQGV